MTGGPLSPALAVRAASMPAGPKLGLLMALATVLMLVQSPVLLGSAAIVALVLCLLVTGPAGIRAAIPVALVVTVVALVAFTLVVEGPRQALVVLLRLVALVLFARLVTASTRASEVQDAIVAGLRPFERLPFVSADKVGLAIAIALGAAPRLGGVLEELREARAARGLKVGPVRLVVPVIVRILADAREMADAIDSRSWSSAARKTQ